MFGWIRRMWDSAAGSIDNVIRSWVRDLMNGLYGFLHLIFGGVIAAWDKLVHAGWLVWHTVDDFVQEVYLAIRTIIKVYLPDLLTWARKAIGLVEQYAKDVYNFAVREIAAARAFAARLVLDAIAWVTLHVYNPLKNAFDLAWHWITHEGALVYYYITHPADLVTLIWDHLIAKLEAEAWTVASKLGRFFLSLVAHNLTKLAALAEDILDALL